MASVVVPDASVVLKWVLPPADEPDADRALALREAIVEERIRALLPALWLYEAANTIARRFPDQAEPWLSALLKFGLEESPPSPKWLSTALALTAGYGAAFYDAAYHATAIVHRGVFVTADAHYVERVKQAGAVVALRDWAPP